MSIKKSRGIALQLLLLISISSFISAKTSQTAFVPRSAAEDLTLELALNGFETTHNYYKQDHYKRPHKKSMISFQGKTFYQGSKNDEDLARYFLLSDKTELKLIEQGGGDISPNWIGIRGISGGAVDTAIGQYHSSISIRPKRETVGFTINHNQDLSMMIKNLWLEFYIPIIQVTHKINFREYNTGEATIIDDATFPFKNALDAFNNPNWLYGRISTSKRRYFGLSDFQIKLGYDILTNYSKSHWGVYGDLLLPTNDGTKADYLFEPIIGSNHYGLGLGTNFDFTLLKGDKEKIYVLGDLKWRHLFSATEKRSFDLKNNGQWSRYLMIAHQNPSTPTRAIDADNHPGINYFTRDMKVKPKDRLDLLIALHGKFDHFHAELGYNLWAKSSEKVSLKSEWNENIGIFDPTTAIAGAVTSSSIANISTPFNGITHDTDFVKITQNDLDLDSARCKSAFTQKFYLGVSWNYKTFNMPCMIGIGSAYEIADRNTAFDQWSAWMHSSISF